jgi:hypothetical protein
MRKFLVVVVAISLLTTGCLVSPPSGTAAAGTKYDATQDTRIVALEGIVLGPNGLQALVGSLSSKISGIADTSGLASRISSVESRVSTVEGRTTTGGVSQATVDALSARIKTLEDWKAALPTGSTGTGGTSPVPVSGQVTYSVYKEPDMVYTPGSYVWYLEVMNGTTEYKKVYLSGILNTVDSYTAHLDITQTKFNSPDLVGGLASGSNGPFSMNFVPVSGEHASMISGMSTGYVIVKGGDKKMVAIMFTLANPSGNTDVSRWEAVWSINAQKYP